MPKSRKVRKHIPAGSMPSVVWPGQWLPEQLPGMPELRGRSRSTAAGEFTGPPNKSLKPTDPPPHWCHGSCSAEAAGKSRATSAPEGRRLSLALGGPRPTMQPISIGRHRSEPSGGGVVEAHRQASAAIKVIDHQTSSAPGRRFEIRSFGSSPLRIGLPLLQSSSRADRDGRGRLTS